MGQLWVSALTVSQCKREASFIEVENMLDKYLEMYKDKNFKKQFVNKDIY